MVPAIILLVDVATELACRIVPALRRAGYRPLRTTGIGETARAVEELGSAINLMVMGAESETGALLARLAPRTRVLNIAVDGLDAARLPDEGWVRLVESALNGR